MSILGDIFVPIVPVIAATGLFLGLKSCAFNERVLFSRQLFVGLRIKYLAVCRSLGLFWD